MHLSRRLGYVSLIALSAHLAFSNVYAQDAGQTAPISSAQFTPIAVVNDDIITQYDVENRVRFVMATGGAPASAESAKQLYPEILQTLINEQLQLQEAARYNIDVTSEEISNAIAGIEKERGREEGALVEFLASSNIPYDTLKRQIESQIAWSKLLQRNVVSDISISKAEMRRMEETEAKRMSRVKEVKLASVIIPIGAQAEQSQKLADTILKDIKAGQPLNAVAAKYNLPAQAFVSPAWLPYNQVAPQMQQIIDEMEGDSGVSEVVRTPNGLQIIMLQGKRVSDYSTDAEMLFKDITLNLSEKADKQEVDLLMSIARNVRKNPGQCSSETIAGAESLEGMDFTVDFTRLQLSSLSPQIKPMVRNLSVGEISEPFATPVGIKLLKLCERVDKPSENNQDAKRIKMALKEEKFKTKAVKYLRDLRSKAFIDIKI